MSDDATGRERLIRENTAVRRPPHVPEITLHLADEAYSLWEKTEEELEQEGLPPPFWAFAWAGGQALARYVLDHPDTVAGRHVLDLASGSGLVAIAALKAGAAEVIANDIDIFCGSAIRLNAALNEAEPIFEPRDLIGTDGPWDVVLAGDIFYEQAIAQSLAAWFDRLSASGTAVLVGDPGRYYLPKTKVEPLATYEIEVERVLEDAEVKRTTVWRWIGHAEEDRP